SFASSFEELNLHLGSDLIRRRKPYSPRPVPRLPERPIRRRERIVSYQENERWEPEKEVTVEKVSPRVGDIEETLVPLSVTDQRRSSGTP
ncbi:hypothetical protein HDU99_008433, partial [Rhizoclosmatium hyalinum]